MEKENMREEEGNKEFFYHFLWGYKVEGEKRVFDEPKKRWKMNRYEWIWTGENFKKGFFEWRRKELMVNSSGKKRINENK